MPSSCATSLLSLLLFLHFAPLVLISKRPFLISLLSELHPCLHHCPSSLYPFDLIHQNTYLCHPPFCHTPAFPIAPCPFLCLLFLSPALSLTSVFPPLCDSLFSLLLPPLFYVCYFCRNYSLLNVSSLSAKFLSSLKPPPLLCSFDFFYQTLMKALGKLPSVTQRKSNSAKHW